MQRLETPYLEVFARISLTVCGTTKTHMHYGRTFVRSMREPRVSESAFAPYVGFGVLITSKLGTNVILMRYVAAISPMKDSKS